jgi:uncharacterized protein
MKQVVKVMLLGAMCLPAFVRVDAQSKGLVNTASSPHAMLGTIDMGDVQWTTGFWADRFAVCRDVMVPHLWKTYTDPKISHSFKNFEIAAGLDSGSFKGPSFHDGDFYKTLEAVAGLYASTKDKKLDDMMDKAIAVIAKAQQDDGYIYTKAIIQKKKTGVQKMFDDRLSFEAYNFGHLMTAACVHYRATGKSTLLEVAKKATDFLIEFYNKATPEQARNAICPSHYMGIVEMYRTTGEKKYLDLVKKLIDIRGMSEGTDDNSDRVPFRKMKGVVGHAVRANYLFAGVADVFAETGDSTLLSTLDLMWDDVVNHKMYVTGGCGALYDGVSVDGISYNPDTVQKVHQSYGKDYQLPNLSAHNETCANIGSVLWNWRMFLLTGEARYADIVELALYNSILSGISLDGDKFFYTNPLRMSDDYPYSLRWTGGRVPYIRLSNCCPPNTVRTIAEVSNYAYSISKNGLYVNLYGANNLRTHMEDGTELQLDQQTSYPWNGSITLTVKKIAAKPYSIFVRIPGWSNGATVTVNGKPAAVKPVAGEYAALKNTWKTGDVIKIELPMPVQLIESNPLVEETRNQVTVKRGPVVYCAESPDMPAGKKVSEITVPVNTAWSTRPAKIDKADVIMLEGNIKWLAKENWKDKLYRPVTAAKEQPGIVRLIPYYAWANRGKSEMSVWLPVNR